MDHYYDAEERKQKIQMRMLQLKLEEEQAREKKLEYIEKKQNRFNENYADLEVRRESKALNTIEAKTSTQRGKVSTQPVGISQMSFSNFLWKVDQQRNLE